MFALFLVNRHAVGIDESWVLSAKRHPRRKGMGRMAAAILPIRSIGSSCGVFATAAALPYGVAQLKPPTTATGDGAGPGFGVPSMPLALLPQHFATPLV